MAMIKCSNCGADISDKAKKCPYCEVKLKRENKKIILAISLVLVVILTCVGTIVGINIKKKNERKIYVQHYNECVQSFNEIKKDGENGIKLCDKLVSLTNSVWSDAVFKKTSIDTINYTFKNDEWQSYSQALNNMYADDTVKSTISSLDDIKKKVNQKLNNINDVPDELKDIYDSAKIFVGAFNDRVAFSSKASGALISYKTSYEAKKSTYSQALSKFTTNMPKEIEE